MMSTTPLNEILPNPLDWRWATWRPFTPLPKPQPQVFDAAAQQAAIERIRKIRGKYEWSWEKAEIPIAMTREEAHFWLTAMHLSHSDWNTTPKQIADKLTGMIFDGSLDDREALKLVSDTRYYKIDRAIIPLWNIVPFRKVVDFVRHDTNRSYGMRVSDFQTCIWPYMTHEEYEEIRSLISKDMANLPAPAQVQNTDLVFALAAMIGGFDNEIEDYLNQISASVPQNHYYGRNYYYDYGFPLIGAIFGLRDPERVKYHTHRLNVLLTEPQHIIAWLAHTETSDLGWIYKSIVEAAHKDIADSLVQTFARLNFPEMAPFMLALRKTPQAGTHPQTWLTDHPEAAALGLAKILTESSLNIVPNLRKEARDYLMLMKLTDQTGILHSIYEKLDDAATKEAFKTQIIDQEPDFLPEFTAENTPEWIQKGVEAMARLKKKPNITWLNFLELPQINLKGYRLTNDQGKALLMAMAQSSIGSVQQFVTDLRTHANQMELDAFVWAIFEHWLHSGAATKDRWAMEALAYFGNDITVMKLTPLIRAWPGESQHQRAIKGLKILESIGTNSALMQINGIAQKVKYNGIKRAANESMEAIAKALNLSREQLADRIIPDCGLDANGTKRFDYGERLFSFVMGPDMKPMLRDEKGKRMANLPKPNKKDDEVKAAEAQAEWKLIKKQIQTLSKTQIDRLQEAMISGRRWKREEFEQFLVHHPLMFHLAKLIVWGGFDAQNTLIHTFRVTEEHDYADINDDDTSLDGIVEVGVIHPMHLSEADRGKWGEILSDYELITPFQQLGRTIFTLEPGEAKATSLTRFAEIRMEPLTMVGILERQGWQRSVTEDGGVFHYYFKTFPFAGVTAILEHDGLAVGALDVLGERKIEACFFVDGVQNNSWYYHNTTRVVLGKVNPIVMSEVLRDLLALAAKGVNA